MNMRPREKDEPLSKVLREWNVASPVPPRFQEQVWSQLARSEAKAPRWSEFLSWLDGVLPRRALAASYLVVLLGTGVGTGYWRGQSKALRVRSELGSRYVQSIDPYQALTARK